MDDPINTETPVQMETCAVRTTTFTGTAFNLKDYIGNVVIVLHCALGTGNADNTLNAKIQHATTSGGSYSDVSGATFAQVTNAAGGSYQTISIDTRAAHGWIKFIATLAGTTPSFVFGVSIIGRKQVQP
jgi:hypothetical protein